MEFWENDIVVGEGGSIPEDTPFWQNDAAIDTERGAPGRVRAAVGAEERKAEDRLATLQQFYPDARPYGDDNFIFNNPETGRPTLYNPPGPDWGDIPEEGRMITEMAAGGLGALAGSVFAPGPGTYVGAGLGTAAGGQLYDAATNFFHPRVDSRSGGEKLTDVGIDMALGAGGQKVGDMASGFISSTLAKKGAPERLKDFTDQGIPIEGAAAAVSGREPVQATQAALSWLPTSSRNMTDAMDATLDGIANRVDEIAEGYSPIGSIDELNNTLLRGAENAGDRFVAKQAKLYDDYMAKIGPKTQIEMTNMRSMLEDVSAQYAEAPASRKYLEPAIRELSAMVADAEAHGGTIPFKVMRDALTDLGQRLKDPNTVTGYTGKTGSSLKRVYAAMRSDVDAAAKNAGAEAELALRLHDNYVRRMAGERLPVMNEVKRRTQDKLYRYVMEGSDQGADRLKKLKRNYLPEEWNQVASTTIHRMGLANPGAQDATGEVFSPAKFVTSWNKMSPEARDILFGQNKELHAAMKQLTRATASFKESLRGTNTSMTAIQNKYLQILTGAAAFGTGGTPGAVAVAAPWVTSKVMTNPKFVKWLARVPLQTENTWTAHLVRLGALAKADPEIREFMEPLMRR